MKTTLGLTCILVIGVLTSLCATATTIGIALGLDPTGLLLINALTETPINESLELRAEVGLATNEIAGLMLATATLLYHQTFDVLDPFFGVGLGAAVTPLPYTTGLVIEGVGGLRVIPMDQFSLFLQARYLVRWSNGGWTAGPLYEAGVQLRF